MSFLKRKLTSSSNFPFNWCYYNIFLYTRYLRRWTSIKPTLFQCVVFAGIRSTMDSEVQPYKSKGSKCLLVKWAVTTLWLCTSVYGLVCMRITSALVLHALFMRNQSTLLYLINRWSAHNEEKFIAILILLSGAAADNQRVSCIYILYRPYLFPDSFTALNSYTIAPTVHQHW